MVLDLFFYCVTVKTIYSSLKTAFKAAVEKDLVVVYDEGLVNNAKIDLYNCFMVIKAYTFIVHTISVLMV